MSMDIVVVKTHNHDRLHSYLGYDEPKSILNEMAENEKSGLTKYVQMLDHVNDNEK